MTYNFLTVEPLTLDTVTAALAHCLSVQIQEVDAADEDTDQELRNWDALVHCEKATVEGDVSTYLDIYVQESVRTQPTERELASAVARTAGTPVAFHTEEMLPSAYWLATEDGIVTRARVYESDGEETRYVIDRVEAPVARLPHVTVGRIPEVVRELKIATPVADAFAAQLDRVSLEETGTAGTPFWMARSRLGAWEKLVRHMEASWAPSGWCPPDLCRERLDARDELDQVRRQLPPPVACLLQQALDPLDTRFAELTADDTGGPLRKELPTAHPGSTASPTTPP